MLPDSARLHTFARASTLVSFIDIYVATRPAAMAADIEVPDFWVTLSAIGDSVATLMPSPNTSTQSPQFVKKPKLSPCVSIDPTRRVEDLVALGDHRQQHDARRLVVVNQLQCFQYCRQLGRAALVENTVVHQNTLFANTERFGANDARNRRAVAVGVAVQVVLDQTGPQPRSGVEVWMVGLDARVDDVRAHVGPCAGLVSVVHQLPAVDSSQLRYAHQVFGRKLFHIGDLHGAVQTDPLDGLVEVRGLDEVEIESAVAQLYFPQIKAFVRFRKQRTVSFDKLALILIVLKLQHQVDQLCTVTQPCKESKYQQSHEFIRDR
ncbi:hypothetical protein OGATHE_005978 [Ogataea polymorpha]|uniref:Uncharacterized protein n=1 Tax=Ogataea polymorpha TaxID=460523 RepID=A0A9P8NT88_9ASCO|nr:hypothetical protein OGATHE_005978 [Ogataea polymorpha]